MTAGGRVVSIPFEAGQVFEPWSPPAADGCGEVSIPFEAGQVFEPTPEQRAAGVFDVSIPFEAGQVFEPQQGSCTLLRAASQSLLKQVRSSNSDAAG